jgi:hypothetical protein
LGPFPVSNFLRGDVDADYDAVAVLERVPIGAPKAVCCVGLLAELSAKVGDGMRD